MAAAALAPAEVAKRHHRASIVADEIRIVKHAAAQHNVVFVMGHAHVVLPKNLPIWHLPRRVLLEIPYKARSTCMPLLLFRSQCCCDTAARLASCPWSWPLQPTCCHGAEGTARRGQGLKLREVSACTQMFADAFSESADSVFGVPSAHLLEIGLPYKLHES